MVRIGLLSDTHSHLPDAVFKHFAEVDEIWHAGDLGDLTLCKQLEAFKPLRAVYGNIDGADIRIRYPENLFFTVEGVPVFMTHIGGYPPRYNTRTKPLLDIHQPHLFICGHSHILKVMPDPSRNLLHINPGACGKQGWHKVSTLIRFSIEGARLQHLEVIEFPKGQ